MEQRRTDPVVIAAISAPFVVIVMWIVSIYMQLK